MQNYFGIVNFPEVQDLLVERGRLATAHTQFQLQLFGIQQIGNATTPPLEVIDTRP